MMEIAARMVSTVHHKRCAVLVDVLLLEGIAVLTGMAVHPLRTAVIPNAFLQESVYQYHHQ